ncbi:uncharacterized protein DNG_09885 [Cephalotrichum gorgonifer]|uniref:Uncharacterized protein n=1 Tax=Cephalotrichum gorgonifer TaxID=2041049 RepID=A0AAE8N6J7_9PEZI|nr:uncharacterized protein DNG_09885 [Cephalotrichum gorgonifer]
MIVPTREPDQPVLPNFFLQLAHTWQSRAIVRRQACHFGAYGARAMHNLQNHHRQDGTKPLVHDRKAYTFSFTLNGGELIMYAHHILPPMTDGGEPEHQMTRVKTFDVNKSHNRLREGVLAFRNARELAKIYRDDFIAAANSALPGSETESD